jgi:L-lysine exporter family protein LysE/ArgO
MLITMSQFFEGFLLQASLILALGAQNLFVLESGLYRRKHLLVATVCTLCDFSLVMIGVLGVSAVFVQLPLVRVIFGVLGVGFLFYYGLKKLLEAKTTSGFHVGAEKKISRKKAVATALGFSLLNPHVYLDTIVLIGGYSSKFPAWQDRLGFGLGASAASGVWFYGLALAAAALSSFLQSPRAMRGVSLISGLVLLGLSFKLGSDVWGWIR